ncbi:MAG TPA: alpha/beta fold hydrolase [Spirochaetota bacterium]|nr:alpha/beta fold hydrolase [Spirochaetota bacterium]HPQ53303.1 alpha/beta fold hydrolase [Spirochaetota bacterium]
MKLKVLPIPGFLLLCVAIATALYGGPAQFAEIGNFTLENGGSIRNCKIGYRTYGRLHNNKDNAVLVTTWFAGTSSDLKEYGFIGPGKMLDTDKFFVIAVDAFGNGVSSSPSNSTTQRGRMFPKYSIRDMVKSQHRLLTGHLGIRKLHAVAGISMGGMQAFQWAVSYPDFMRRVVSVSGTTHMTSYDKLVWSSELAIITSLMKRKAGNAEIMKTVAPVHQVFVWTPGYRVSATDTEKFHDYIVDAEKSLQPYNAVDWASQLRAMLSHNIGENSPGGLETAVKKIKSKMLIIGSDQDYAVYSGPSKEIASRLGARIIMLHGNCGHFSFFCEKETLSQAVKAFLEEND